MSNRIQAMSLALAVTMITAWSVSSQGQIVNEHTKLQAADGGPYDELGVSVDIDGGIVVVGAHHDGENGGDSGSAYLFDAATGTQLAKLTPSDPASWDVFGASVAIEGSIVAVGMPGDDNVGNSSGAVYLFDVATGAQIRKIIADDSASGDRFGSSMSLQDGILAVGAPQNALSPGVVYLIDVNTGQEIRKLAPDDGEPGDAFGGAVSIDGSFVVVGAERDDDHGSDSGSAYLFDRGNGSQLAKLLPSDGAFNDRFGGAVAVGSGVVAVGAYWDDDLGVDSGSAYLFDASTGEQLRKLVPADPNGGAIFGISLAIAGDHLVVGKSQDNDNGSSSGSAFLFDVSTGDEVSKLLPSDGDGWDSFGVSVAIDGDLIVAGAMREDGLGHDAGAAYLFDVGPADGCLDLDVTDLVGGERATFTITGGTPGRRAITVYGFMPGQSSVDGVGGYCATFGIDGVNQGRIVGGLSQTFDASGEIRFDVVIPPNARGLDVWLQSAEQGTCPDECVSNLVFDTIQ